MGDSRYDPRAHHEDEEAPPRPYADLEVPPDVYPTGEAYDWFVRGADLLEQGNAAAAAQILAHAHASEPASRAVLEALARAQFDSAMYPEAQASFTAIIEVNPGDDYAQFGLGLAAAQNGDLETAARHLGLAAAMRPDITHYSTAARGARAALSSRR